VRMPDSTVLIAPSAHQGPVFQETQQLPGPRGSRPDSQGPRDSGAISLPGRSRWELAFMGAAVVAIAGAIILWLALR
jgi:hypothetical protein